MLEDRRRLFPRIQQRLITTAGAPSKQSDEQKHRQYSLTLEEFWRQRKTRIIWNIFSIETSEDGLYLYTREEPQPSRLGMNTKFNFAQLVD